MAEQYTNEDIDAYLSGRLDAAARSRFEKALTEDAQLAEKLDTFRAEKAVFQLLEKDTLLDQLQAWDEEEEQQPVPSSRKWWWLVITLLLSVILSYYIYSLSDAPTPPPPSEQKTEVPLEQIQEGQQEQSPTPESAPPPPSTQSPSTPPIAELDYRELADRYYQQAPFANQLRSSAGSSGTDSTAYQKAQQRYQKDQFTAALALLLTPDSTQLKKSLYLRAHTHYQLGDYVAAQQDFAAFRDFLISDRKKDAEWGEVLSLLQRMPQSRNELYALLEGIIAQGDTASYYAEASALLAVLQNNQ